MSQGHKYQMIYTLILLMGLIIPWTLVHAAGVTAEMAGSLQQVKLSQLPLADFVKVDKSERRMHLMRNGAVIKTYHIALGASPKGHKRQQGDEKTPEGIYTLDYVKEDSSFYRAMHISYPNAIDRQQAKKRGVSPGGFIMVHGQRNGLETLSHIAQQYNWTDGCIALHNHEMDEFLSLVAIGTKIQIQW